MGGSWSRVDAELIKKSELLQRFASPETLAADDAFWNGFLSFHVRRPKTRSEWRNLEEESAEILRRFAKNNVKSGNFGALVDIYVKRSAALGGAEDAASLLLALNALFLIRVIAKSFVESLREDAVAKQFDSDGRSSSSDEATERDRIRDLVTSLTNTLLDRSSLGRTYDLHVEAASTLLVLLSSPMYHPTKAAFQMKAFRVAMAADRAGALTMALLANFGDQMVSPPSPLHGEEGGSIVLGLASGMWNILTLGYNSTVSSTEDENGTLSDKAPLSEASLLLLLVLTNHCTDVETGNPYREALFQSSNSVVAPAGDGPPDAAAKEGEASLTVDFSRVFRALCDTLSSDESTLLLYMLLHRNAAFRTYVLASSSVECVVIPLLKTLYNAPSSNSHHIYMSLIVLLILSEDELFNTSVHNMNLRNVEWYHERPLNQGISLGGLLILVVIRTIQYNMLKIRDKYLHSNCLAALANMSGQFKNLHSYVSQRIVSMFEVLIKKHTKLVAVLQNSGEIEDHDSDSAVSEALADISVLEEVLRMVLEIINSCLVRQIKHNANLIYTLLYKRELFEAYMANPTFEDLIQNVHSVIVYFSTKLEQAQTKKGDSLSAQEVQDVIQQVAIQFPREKLTKFPELKFKYVEEEQPEEFFVPYVWSVVSHRMCWDGSNKRNAHVPPPT